MQLKHATHREASMAPVRTSMHCALHARRQSPHFTQALGAIRSRQAARRATRPSSVPTGQAVLQNSRSRHHARPPTNTSTASDQAAADQPSQGGSTR